MTKIFSFHFSSVLNRAGSIVGATQANILPSYCQIPLPHFTVLWVLSVSITYVVWWPDLLICLTGRVGGNRERAEPGWVGAWCKFPIVRGHAGETRFPENLLNCNRAVASIYLEFYSSGSVNCEFVDLYFFRLGPQQRGVLQYVVVEIDHHEHFPFSQTDRISIVH